MMLALFQVELKASVESGYVTQNVIYFTSVTYYVREPGCLAVKDSSKFQSIFVGLIIYVSHLVESRVPSSGNRYI